MEIIAIDPRQEALCLALVEHLGRRWCYGNWISAWQPSLKLPYQCVNELVDVRRGLTRSMVLRLAKVFGTSLRPVRAINNQ